MNKNPGLKPGGERLEFVDSLRGFALFGVFYANLLIFSGIDYMTAEQRASLFGGPLNAFAHFFELFFIENKFMGLFSFLFGISFWLFLSRVQGRTASPTGLFYRRFFWLFAFGAIHGWLFWCFDILRFYALWAMLLPLFVHTAGRRLLIIALATAVLLPALIAAANAWLALPRAGTTDYDALTLTAFTQGSYAEVLRANWRYDWYLTFTISQVAYQVAIFGRLLLGLYVARTFDLGNLAAYRRVLWKTLLFGGLIGLTGSTIFAGKFLVNVTHNPWVALIRRLLVEGGQLGLTLAYASALALAFQSPGWRRAIRLLAPIGQMALTWYLLQTAFGLCVFYGFTHGPALMRRVGPASLTALALIGFSLQVVCARGWMSRFPYGPAEWCWRSLTYLKLQPFVRPSVRPQSAAIALP
jgi:uncharacterized protein